MAITNRQFRLAARPVGLPTAQDWQFTETPVGEPQVVHPRSASLSLATGRIAETDLSEASRSRLDVSGLRVFEQCELQSPQGLFKPER